MKIQLKISFLLVGCLAYIYAEQDIDTISPPIQVISGAYIHPLNHLVPYERFIPIYYSMNLTQPRVHHLDDLAKYGCQHEEIDSPEEISKTEDIVCKLLTFALANLQTVDRTLTSYEDYLTVTSQHSMTRFGEDTVFAEDLPPRPRSIAKPRTRLDLSSESNEVT